MEPKPDYSAVRKEMGDNHFYGFKLGQDGGVDVAMINAANLWGAIKNKVPLPRKLLSISVSNTSIRDLLDCDPTYFKSLNAIGLFSMPLESDAPADSRCHISDEVIQWLGKLDVLKIGFNANTFDPLDLKKAETTPALAAKFYQEPSLHLRRPFNPDAQHTMN